MSKVKPLKGVKLKENRILIADFETIKETAGGILLPEAQWIIPEGGLVVSVGPGKTDTVTGTFVKNLCSVGERVYYLNHGQKVDIDGKECYLLRDGDVWGEID